MLNSNLPTRNIRDEVAALKRERALTAAVELFYERGYENTTLEAVADRLGVTKPFIYAHFSSKAELLGEISARGIASALEAMNAVLAVEGSATEKLELLGRNFVVATLTSRMHLAIFAREEKNLTPEDFARITAMRREFDRKLTALLAAGAASGEFQIDDPRMATLAIDGMISWAYIWYRPNGRLTLEQIAAQLSRMILALVRAKPKAKRAGGRAGAKSGGAARPARRGRKAHAKPAR